MAPTTATDGRGGDVRSEGGGGGGGTFERETGCGVADRVSVGARVGGLGGGENHTKGGNRGDRQAERQRGAGYPSYNTIATVRQTDRQTETDRHIEKQRQRDRDR